MTALNQHKKETEQGYVLLGVLLITFLSLLVTGGMLDSSASNAKTRAVVNTQADNYYEVEETLNKTVAWLQDNSKYIVDGFLDANFATNFDLGSPALGDNEGQHFSVPTMVKMAGTNDSVILSTNDFFGTDSFPALTHIDSGAAFDAAAEFQAADLGNANARIILIWARATDGAYEPIFRIDVVTGNNPDRGVHSYSYVYSTIVAGGGGAGFYGRDYLGFTSPNNDCYSYQFTHDGANWNVSAPRANCPAAGDGTIDVKAKVNGTADTLTNNGIVYLPPGGTVSGATCEGAGCHTYTLPALNDWNTYCGGVGASMTVTGTTPLAPGCYDTITINAGKTLEVQDASAPYYVKSVVFKGNGSEIDFGTIPPGDQIELFVEDWGNTHLNGNRLVNDGNAPHQLQINYIGVNDLTLNGTADLYANITAPFAHVDVLGDFTMFGGIQAAELEFSGKARIGYDETLGTIPTVTDVNFALKKTSQRYR